MIEPTIGRVVLFWPTLAYARDKGMAYEDTGKPLPAIITYVHNLRMVNLAVFDQNGENYPVTSVPLFQDGEPVPNGGFYCEWMPYQKGQAAKTEALAEQLRAVADPKQSASTLPPAGPSLTMDDIQAAIVDESYQALAGTRVTTCCLTLRNGTKVVGIHYGLVSPGNFSAEKGRQYAREHAIEQIWPLEGYLLRQRLYEQEQDAEQMLVAEVEAGQAAAEALIDHLEAMGNPASFEIPVTRDGRSFKVKVVTE